MIKAADTAEANVTEEEIDAAQVNEKVIYTLGNEFTEEVLNVRFVIL